LAEAVNRIESLALDINKLLPKAQKILGDPGVQTVQRKLSEAKSAVLALDSSRIQNSKHELERSLTTLQGLVAS